MALTALVWSLGFLSVAGQYDDNVGSVLPTPTLESNCFQNQLSSNFQPSEFSEGRYVRWFQHVPTMTFARLVCWVCSWTSRALGPPEKQPWRWHLWSINATGPFETSAGTTARMKRATWLRGWCKSLQIYLTSPDGQPWGSAVNTIGAGGVWFFPRGWPHAFVCVSEEGCNYVLTFNGPQAVAANDHMIAETYTQMPDEIVSYSMGMSQGEWAQAKPKAAAFTARFFAKVIPEKFHWLEETTSLPAAVNRSDVEVEDINPNLGAKLGFPLPPGCPNNALSSNRAASVTGFGSPMLQPSWTVISGHVNAGTQGGISGGFDTGPSSTLYTGENLETMDFFHLLSTSPFVVAIGFKKPRAPNRPRWLWSLKSATGRPLRFQLSESVGRSLGLWIYDGKHHLSGFAFTDPTWRQTQLASPRVHGQPLLHAGAHAAWERWAVTTPGFWYRSSQ